MLAQGGVIKLDEWAQGFNMFIWKTLYGSHYAFAHAANLYFQSQLMGFISLPVLPWPWT